MALYQIKMCKAAKPAGLVCTMLVGLALSGAASAQSRSAQEAVEHGAKVSRPIGGDTNPVATMVTGKPTPPAAGMSSSGQHRGGMGGAMSRTDVRDLQTALNKEGAGLRVDGAMGPRTREALMAFQSRNDLPVSGHLDSDTRMKLGM